MKSDLEDFNIDYTQHRYLRTPDAAKLLGLSGRTLEKHRTFGTGPQYFKLGGRVVYRLVDLTNWVKPGCKASTSDPGQGTVLPAKRLAVSPQKQKLVTKGDLPPKGGPAEC
jgi:predicted DNA-binding transcriptional regulator AlpA